MAGKPSKRWQGNLKKRWQEKLQKGGRETFKKVAGKPSKRWQENLQRGGRETFKKVAGNQKGGRKTFKKVSCLLALYLPMHILTAYGTHTRCLPLWLLPVSSRWCMNLWTGAAFVCVGSCGMDGWLQQRMLNRCEGTIHI